jgi:uncharacterized protein YndB with AHSA1/START domain
MPELIGQPIYYETFVRAPPDRVYDGIATAEGLDGWFTAGAEVDARPGGRIRFRWKDWGPSRISAEDGGPILEARRPERFVFQWHPDDETYATTVEIEFEEVEGGTIIRLRESGYRDTDSGRRAMLECAAGWGEALTLWKVYIEHGIRY